MKEQDKNDQTITEESVDTAAGESESTTYDASEPEAASEAGSADSGEADQSDPLDELRKQADEHYQRYLRTQADFDNFRRRSRLEKEDFAKYASMKLIEQLLPVVDNFERAISTTKESQDFASLVKGIEMTFRQLDQVLVQEGLTPIEAVGQPFNPELHQAIMQVESDEHEDGTVVEEMQKGYMLKEKVLRPSMVKVSTKG
ncbi:nucleotide exchange factor GrpE [Paenibacillus sp. MBLB4367]|uniref:nucleotide exchange factor GrpE n=1 Tax=Paenibacillus sp. MBLB4367 TaxID=3384767 RepID=UPI0039081811